MDLLALVPIRNESAPLTRIAESGDQLR